MEVVGSDGTKLSILQQNYLYLYIPHPIYIALRELWGLRYELRKFIEEETQREFYGQWKKDCACGCV